MTSTLDYEGDDGRGRGYSYDGAGNIIAMGADTFKYDKLSRLTFGTAESGQFSEQNVYDAFGNRVAATTNSSGTPLARQNPTDPQTNRLLGTTSRPVAYDTRGNLTTWGTASYTYARYHGAT